MPLLALREEAALAGRETPLSAAAAVGAHSVAGGASTLSAIADILRVL